MDFQYNGGAASLLQKLISQLSDAQKALLSDIALAGPVDIYGAHLRMEKSLTTVQNAMKKLEGLKYVEVSKREEGKTGQIKKVYSLTFLGFCTAVLVVITDSKSGESLVAADDFFEQIHAVIRMWNNEFDSVILRKWDFLMESYDVPLDVEKSFRLMLCDALAYASRSVLIVWSMFCVSPDLKVTRPIFESETLIPNFERHFFMHVASKSVAYEPNTDDDLLGMLAHKARKDSEIWKAVHGFLVDRLDYHKTMVQRLERIFLLERLSKE